MQTIQILHVLSCVESIKGKKMTQDKRATAVHEVDQGWRKAG